MDRKEELNKSIDMMIDEYFKKAEMPKMEHDYPGVSVIDQLIGAAQLSDAPAPQMQFAPQSPDYGMQPRDMQNETGGESWQPRMREQMAPTSPDYGMQPADLEKNKLKDEPWQPRKRSPGEVFAPPSPDLGLQPEKTYEEQDGDRGRPKQVSDVPDVDEDKKRAKGYEHVQMETAKIPEEHDRSQPVRNQDFREFKKSEGIVISKEDYELLQNIKKQKENESLKKAQDLQVDLLKSVFASEMQTVRAENESLKKSILETNNLIKAMSRVPREQKSISNISALKKSFVDERYPDESDKTFSKQEMLEAAEELVKSRQIPVEYAIELESTGTIAGKDASSEAARKLIERQLNTKKLS